MKNLFKVFGIITIVALIGFSFATCGSNDDSGGGGSGGGNGGGNGNSGTFTLTDIPAEYNEKYADFGAANESESIMIRGSQSKGSIVLSRISNGRVSIPLYTIQTDWVGYTGNDTLNGGVIIYSNNILGKDRIIQRLFLVKFSNGSATISWNDGV